MSDSNEKLHTVLLDLGKMAGTVSQKSAQITDHLAAALKMAASICGLPYSMTPADTENMPDEDRIRQFAFLNGWRTRKVKIRASLASCDHGTLIAFDREEGKPFVLTFNAGLNEIHDPATGGSSTITDSEADQFRPDAYYLYSQLPDTPVTTRQLYSFVAKDAPRRLKIIMATGLLGGLFSLIFPVVVQYVTGEVIPSADTRQLWQLTALLVILTTSSVIFGIIPQYITMSFGATGFERLQAALCDRILKSPPQLFKRFNVGDLAQRILSATSIQDTFLSVISNQILASVFSMGSLFMLFYFNAKLAVMGIAFALTYAAIMLLLYKRNLIPLRTSIEAEGSATGLLKQFIDGMPKIRVAGAETRAIAKYFETFSEVVRADYRVNKNSAAMQIVSSIFPAFVSSVFFAVIVLGLAGEIDIPRFLGFMAAYASFQQGITGIASDLWSLLAIKPQIERIKPILQTSPEQTSGRQLPGKLDGTIEVINLTFSYAPDLPPVLRNISLTARKGEMIAIVGPSGSGKSTLVRLLLGFETPLSGGVYFSGRDLANLNLRAVRRQMGVIMQNSGLIHGSILDNITGGTEYTLDDAWKAIELASLTNDVASLPMGIHTIVNDRLVSGGQRQRILLARALAGRPAAVILDESTSALDNVTQQEVSDNMAKLDCTRIIIAHRLSTIRHADRIYVLDDGEITQCGTYEELLPVEGTFRSLALRQLVETSNL